MVRFRECDKLLLGFKRKGKSSFKEIGKSNGETAEKQLEVLGLEEAADRFLKANRIGWYGHVLRKDGGGV